MKTRGRTGTFFCVCLQL